MRKLSAATPNTARSTLSPVEALLLKNDIPSSLESTPFNFSASAGSGVRVLFEKVPADFS
jgi:hypothetical protein